MLNKLQKLREEREQGFTLIELLVVILIIGILAAIAIPAFMNQRKSAVDTTVESDVKNAATAVETTNTSKGKGQAVTLTDGDAPESTGATEYDYKLLDASTGAAIGSGTTKVSKGTELKFSGGSETGFVIEGNNDGGDESTIESGGIQYDSGKGGLQTDRTGNTGNPDAGGEEAAGTVLAHSLSNIEIMDTDNMDYGGVTDVAFYSDGRIEFTNARAGYNGNGGVLNGTFTAYIDITVNGGGIYEQPRVTFVNGKATIKTASYDANEATSFSIILDS